MNDLKVSVLMPVHNAGAYVKLAVESVLAQTYSNFELLLVDDGSADSCTDAVDGIADPRIRLFRQAQRGAAAALNTALTHASGELIAFLDHDDLWLPEKLAAHVGAFAASPELDLAFDWSRIIDENGADLGLASLPWRGPISFEQFVMDFAAGNTSAMVVRRSAVDRAGRFNESLHRIYDADLCWRVAALRPGNCRSIERYLTRYRRHPGQMSRSWRDSKAEWERLLSLVPGYSPGRIDRILPIADSNMQRYFSALAMENGEPGAAIALALAAFSKAPGAALGDSRNWMILAASVANATLPRSLFERVAGWGRARFHATPKGGRPQ